MGRPSCFPTADDRHAYVSAYERALGECTVPIDELDLDSHFGTTHVLRAGTDGPAIVFLHGKTNSSTMWLGQLPALAERHRSYLVDTIGDMNKSVATAMLETKADVVEWLDLTLDALGLQGTTTAGRAPRDHQPSRGDLPC